MSPGLRAVGVILASLLVIVGAASGANQPRSQGWIGTAVHFYDPFNASGIANGIRVTRSVSGYCWTISGASARGDAFRCSGGINVHDPCFADFVNLSNYVLCPLSYPKSNVLRINLTKKLPADKRGGDPNPEHYSPWAVKTTTGKWCALLTGASYRIAGLWIRYACKGGGVLLGRPRRDPLGALDFSGLRR
jgi:hypothetical protein